MEMEMETILKVARIFVLLAILVVGSIPAFTNRAKPLEMTADEWYEMITYRQRKKEMRKQRRLRK